MHSGRLHPARRARTRHQRGAPLDRRRRPASLPAQGRARRSSSRSPSCPSPRRPHELLRAGYPLLVRALANLCVMVSDTPDGLRVRFVTLEQGIYGVGPGLADDELLGARSTGIEPLASSQLVIANDFVTDLPEHLWDGDEQTAQMLRRGTRARRARPAARAVPDRGDPRPARSAARRAALRHRRPVVRQRQRALPGRRPAGRPRPRRSRVLDERERRRQVRPAARRPAHPARPRLRPRPRHDGAERPARREAAPRVGRRDRALDDLPRAPRRRRDPARARMDRRHRVDRGQLSRAARCSSRRRSPTSCAPRPTPHARSSGYAITA